MRPMPRLAVAAVLALAVVPDIAAAAAPRASPRTLARFESEAQLADFLDRLRQRLAEQRAAPRMLAKELAQAPASIAAAPPPAAAEPGAAAESVTNVQTAGVD